MTEALLGIGNSPERQSQQNADMLWALGLQFVFLSLRCRYLIILNATKKLHVSIKKGMNARSLATDCCKVCSNGTELF